MRLSSLAVVLGLFVASVHTKDAHAQSKISKEEAGKRFGQADQHYKLQEFEKALDGFTELYRLTQEPLLLFNIAQCHRQMGHLEEALKGYKFFLQEAPDSETNLRQNAQTRITELEAAIESKKKEEAEAARLAALAASSQPKPPGEGRSPRPFFLTAAAVGGAGVLCGGAGLGLAFFSARTLSSATTPEEVAKGNQMTFISRVVSPVGDGLAAAALVSASVGFFLWRQSPEKSVAVYPGGVNFVVSF